MTMHLQVLLPVERLIDCQVTKFVGDGQNGSFCLLPRHVDFVSALRAGVSSFVGCSQDERFLGHSHGLIVKAGHELSIVVNHAIVGDCLEELQQIIGQHFHAIDEHERTAVATIARLEADFVRRYLDLENRSYA